MLRFTLLVHLITSKVSVFESIKANNIDLQIPLNELQSSDNILPDNLKLAAYSRVIEENYPDFAAADKSLARKKSLLLSEIISELEDEEQISSE